MLSFFFHIFILLTNLELSVSRDKFYYVSRNLYVSQNCGSVL